MYAVLYVAGEVVTVPVTRHLLSPSTFHCPGCHWSQLPVVCWTGCHLSLCHCRLSLSLLHRLVGWLVPSSFPPPHATPASPSLTDTHNNTRGFLPKKEDEPALVRICCISLHGAGRYELTPFLHPLSSPGCETHTARHWLVKAASFSSKLLMI